MGKGISLSLPGWRGEPEAEQLEKETCLTEIFPVSDEMQEMILLMPHAFLCLWSSLRRRRPNREVQNTGDTGSCSPGGE